MSVEIVGASFRDPSGFVFTSGNALYRQVNQSYREQYDLLLDSGLYQRLTDRGLLVPHEEVGQNDSPVPEKCFKVLKPRRIRFISYPYEWSFSQLKDAALATLEVQKEALECGMTLKDGSAYNIQFEEGRPLMIDTLSFERYVEGMPWIPYRQFCQHFLAPLALMSTVDIRLGQLLRVYVDGVPLELASRLLPGRTRLSVGLNLHIHMHARTQHAYEDKPVGAEKFRRSFTRTALLGLLDSLEGSIRKLTWKPQGTEWADYYADDSYTPAGLDHKKQLVAQLLAEALPEKFGNSAKEAMPVVWDLGANTGLHSRLACEAGAFTIAFDVDPACVEINYLEARDKKETRVLPLVMDLTNPSPGLGWAGAERDSFSSRGAADCVMALALVHHIAISNNVPLDLIADFFGGICESLIIEFVPKSDHKVQRLLATREDVFPCYTLAGFEDAFGRVFEIRRRCEIRESDRVLYLMGRI